MFDRLIQARGRPLFLVIVVAPMLLLSLYYGLVSSDRYVSQATFTIKENVDSSVSSGIGGLISIARPPAIQDILMLQTFIESNDMLDLLDAELGLRAHYRDGSIDLFSRLADDASREDQLDYYRKRIALVLDEPSNVMSIELQGFEPIYAQNALRRVLTNGEAFVNEVGHRLAQAQLDFVEQQLQVVQEALREAKGRLLEFQDRNRLLSPEQTGQSMLGIIDSLQAELARERANLKQLRSYQQKGAPQVMASEERIQALEAQIEDETAKLVGQGDSNLNELVAEYTNLQLELEFSKDAYASTLAALEQSRAEATKKLKHLVVVTEPTLPDEALYPRKAYILVTALFVLMLMYGIARMVLASIQEHQD
jgi:capsular polysaccharide transport system permease protein